MKNAIIIILGILTILSCKNESKTAGDSNIPADKTLQKKENLAGGWVEAAVENDVEEALDFALEEINAKAKLKNVLRAMKQVVKGLNYDLTFSLENGETWNALVYRDLDGNYSLTQKSKMPMPGGWSNTEITPEVEEAVEFVVSHLNNASALKEIVSAKSQVVRGVNYDVTFSLENSSVWTAKVHHGLDGRYSLLQETKKQ